MVGGAESCRSDSVVAMVCVQIVSVNGPVSCILARVLGQSKPVFKQTAGYGRRILLVFFILNNIFPGNRSGPFYVATRESDRESDHVTA